MELRPTFEWGIWEETWLPSGESQNGTKLFNDDPENEFGSENGRRPIIDEL